jgi:dephospho-CoA kinase
VLRVGLTGGIGSGKSTVAGWLAERGALVIDADSLAREVVAAGTPGLAAVAEAFGPDVLGPSGELDRVRLGRLVFDDEAAREKLNTLTHPRIAERTRELIAAADPGRIIVHDVPLLVEKRMGAQYHLVVVVHAEAAERVERLRVHRGMAVNDAWSRVRAQAGDAERRRAADVWLDSGVGLDGLRHAVGALWQERLEPFNHHLVLRERAPRGRAVVVPYREEWPDDAARLIERIRRAVGDDPAAPVEHMGSTAVPGLPAKDVIDLMLGVRSLDQADALRPALEQAGFVCLPHLVQDTPHPVFSADPAHWTKRFHASCDPGRPVNLHVRVIGEAGWRAALLMRDWFRAEPAIRQEYAALKLGLAAQGISEAEYALAKEPWMAKAMPRALGWAAAPPTPR